MDPRAEKDVLSIAATETSGTAQGKTVAHDSAQTGWLR
jgi:hypothetical protein